jgi:hypothetical protein
LAVALDGTLTRIWQVPAEPDAMGHMPSVRDVDGDGCDEVILGNLLVDHDGKRLWKKEAATQADSDGRTKPYKHPPSVYNLPSYF